MPNVVRFALSSARDLYVPGAGYFEDGILDVPQSNTRLVSRARYLTKPFGAVELGVTDETTPHPALPATGPGEALADPYPQYPTLDEVAAAVASGTGPLPTALRAALVAAANPKDFGAKGNARHSYVAAMTSGSAVLTAADGAFTTADIGKAIYVEGAAADGALWTTIASRQSATQITLASTAAATVTGVRALWGNDDTAAIAAAYAWPYAKAVRFPDGGFITDTIIVPDGSRTIGAGALHTTVFAKPVTLVGTGSGAAHSVFFHEDDAAPRLKNISISDLVVDGAGPRPLAGALDAANGGTAGLHRGTRGTSDENRMEGINFKNADALRLTNVVAQNCIGDGFDLDQNQGAVLVGCVADNVRIGFHTSNATRRTRYIGCTAMFSVAGFDQNTASGHDSLENVYDSCVAFNNLTRNFNIMATTPDSNPGNPEGQTPAPSAPFYGVTLPAYAITAGTTALTATGAGFTRASVGQRIKLYGAGAAGADLSTWIDGYTSSTAVTIRTAASTTVTEAQAKKAAVGWGVPTARVINCDSFTTAVDNRDGRTGRAPSAQDDLRGALPDGKYKKDTGNTQGGGLGLAGTGTDEVTTLYSHANSVFTAGFPSRLLARVFFGNDPAKRRVQWGGVYEGTNATGFGVWTASGAASGAELERFHVDAAGNVELAPQGQLTPNAANGFTYLPSVNGAPTGTPTVKPGQIPAVVDSSTGTIYVNPTGSAWVGIAPPAPAGVPVNEKLARRTTDMTINGSGTQTNDDTLFLAVEANSVYEMRCFLIYDTTTAADIKVGFTGPTGATLDWNALGSTSLSTDTQAGSNNSASFTAKDITGTQPLGGAKDAGGTLMVARPSGMLVTGGTAGTFRLQWSQNTNTAYDTKMKTGSYMRLTKVV